jgi:cytochrome b561
MSVNAPSGLIAATRIAAGDDRTRYDGLAMTLHWLTVPLVLIQFGLAELWDFAPRPGRNLMIVAHMSFGIMLTLVLMLRVGWRLTPGHQVRDALSGWVEKASKAVHYLLYGLLAAEAVLGFLLRWSGNEAMSFFGLPIPPPFAPFSKPAHHLVGEAHNWIAWTIIILAAGHAFAALFHHFVLHDDVLWRMLPGRRAALAEARAPSPERAAQRQGGSAQEFEKAES